MNQEIDTPHGFVTDIFERDFSFNEEKINLVWSKLQRRETFTRSQLFPYRVEFAASSQEGEFSPGELNIHHGPFLSLHGAIGTVTSSYRGLDYFYGSYVISFRFIRPVQLEFFLEDKKIKVKVKAFVKRWIRLVWRLSNRILWFSFQLSMNIKKS